MTLFARSVDDTPCGLYKLGGKQQRFSLENKTSNLRYARGVRSGELCYSRACDNRVMNPLTNEPDVLDQCSQVLGMPLATLSPYHKAFIQRTGSGAVAASSSSGGVLLTTTRPGRMLISRISA